MNFRFTNNQEQHICQASIEGDEIVFTCQKCPGYERRINNLTGAMKTKGKEEYWHINHYGAFCAVPGLSIEVDVDISTGVKPDAGIFSKN